MSIVTRVLKSPEQAIRLAEKGALVGYREGDILNPAGEIIKVTDSGKTVWTNKDIVFTYRKTEGKFTLKGESKSDCVVLTPEQAKRVKRQAYMRRYMKAYLAKMPKRKKIERRAYMRQYMKDYLAKKRAETRAS